MKPFKIFATIKIINMHKFPYHMFSSECGTTFHVLATQLDVRSGNELLNRLNTVDMWLLSKKLIAKFLATDMSNHFHSNWENSTISATLFSKNLSLYINCHSL